MRKCQTPFWVLGSMYWKRHDWIESNPLSQSQAFGALGGCKVRDATSSNWAGGALESNSIVATYALGDFRQDSSLRAWLSCCKPWKPTGGSLRSLNSYTMWFSPSLVSPQVKKLSCRFGEYLFSIHHFCWQRMTPFIPDSPFLSNDVTWSLRAGSCPNSLPNSRPGFLS